MSTSTELLKMDSQKRIICRFCFKIQDNLENFKAIEEDMKDILDKVLQKMNFAAIQHSVICTHCADTLIKCFDFKAKCINTYDYIAPFINKDTVKLNLIDVYFTKNENSTGVLEIQNVCGLCMSPVKNCSSLSFDVERDVALKKMIEQCLPELDMNIIKKPVICLSCHGSLENCFRFLTNCVIVEEKISKYCQNIDSKGGIELSSLLQFEITSITRNIGDSSAELIKAKNEFCEEIENVDETGIDNGGDIFKFEQMSCDDHELELKNESFMDTELKFNSAEHFTPKNILACKEDVIKIEEPFCGENKVKEENLVEIEDQKFLLNEKVEVKTDESDFKKFEDGILPEPKIGNGNLNVHLLVHKNLSKLTMYKCNSCLFETKRKKSLNSHLLRHKDPSEVTMYKCYSCSYQAKRKENLKCHLLTHKDPSELTMYKCDSCPYQTNREGNIKRHLLKHKDPLEVTMYKCNLCAHQTKNKFLLKKHFLVHKDPSELTMYKCGSCLFQTKHKKSLASHLLQHKDPSEVIMYKCDSCSYEAKTKENLKRHLLYHKNPSELTIYKCDSCSYLTKDKGGLRRHFQKHKDPSEVTIYKCDSCSYQAKSKRYLARHLLIHKGPSEVTMYKCDSCSYQTKYKNAFKKHLMKHKDPSNVTMYKCASCSFQTKHKNSLNRHLQKHKDPSEVPMYTSMSNKT